MSSRWNGLFFGVPWIPEILPLTHELAASTGHFGYMQKPTSGILEGIPVLVLSTLRTS